MGQVARIARRLDVRASDVAIVAILTVFAVVQGSPQEGAEVSPAVFLAIVPLLVRRRWPIAVLGAALLGFALAGNGTDFAALLGGLVAAISVGLYSRHQNVAIAAIVGTSLYIALEFGHGGATSTLPVPGAILPFVLLGAAYLAGREIGSRQKALHEQGEAAARQAAEHEASLKAAAEAERRHIARELHDVVAHSVSVMVVQAGAARKVLEDKPEAAAQSLLNVESVGHETMAELRRLLGVLGQNGEDAPLQPQPTINQLSVLVERMRDSGLPVEVTIEGDQRPLPAGVDVAAYRIVQEALTNALKYADGARTKVNVRYQADALDVEVADEGRTDSPASGIGRGLLGMRERVALFGGTIDAGKRPEGGYAVRAHLPCAS